MSNKNRQVEDSCLFVVLQTCTTLADDERGMSPALKFLYTKFTTKQQFFHPLIENIHQ